MNVIVDGGIGDLILALPLIQHFLEITGYCIKINVYSSFPEIAKYFLPSIIALPTIPYFRRDGNDFDYSISISDMVYFNKKPNTILPPSFQHLYNNWVNIFKDWELFLTTHPFNANDMAHKALRLGLRRWTLPFFSVGKEYEPYKFYEEIGKIECPNKFITIHDGFDATNHYKFERSTKSWSIVYWEKFVTLFKNEFPNIQVVQLGGVKHKPIKNADINLAGQLEFTKTLQYLNSSFLHIDGDSGLVHARKLFNKPSVVIFGSTNVEYFGYKENINIAPNFCGDCWWKKSDWMQNCKEKYESPKCIDSVIPEEVFKKVKNMLLMKDTLTPE